jgi:hypothetical protein
MIITIIMITVEIRTMSGRREDGGAAHPKTVLKSSAKTISYVPNTQYQSAVNARKYGNPNSFS